jgi:hypothetical protein
MVELELYGLNARQQFLADILWQLEEYDDVQAFIATLPDREACECESIIEMMKLALVEQYAEGMKDQVPLTEAQQLIDKVRK